MKVKSNLIEAHIIAKTVEGIRFLLLKRSKYEIYPDVWQMVTGTVKENEKGYEAAIREIKEETGLNPERMWVVPNVNSFYNPSDDSVCLVPVFVAMVSGNENVKISEEHSDYKWVDEEEAKKLLAWRGQRKSVETIREYFTEGNSFLKFVQLEISKER